MPSALWTLLWLNFRAVLRKTGRQMRSVRGILFFVVGIGVFGTWIGPSIYVNSHSPRVKSETAMSTAPVVIFGLTLLNLFTAAGERAVTFTPAEIDFLFPGPFTRRQLLSYKLIKTGLATLLSALIFGVVLGRYGGSFPCRMLGVWLLFQFFQLLAMVVALLQASIGERLVTMGRRWVLVVLCTIGALAVLDVVRNQHELSLAILTDAGKTTAGQIVLAPFKVFAHALLASDFFFEGLSWSAIAAAIDLVMVGVVLGLDANYLETSATISAKRYDRLARIRRSGLGGTAKAKSSSWKIAMLPWLAGTGPIIWRQLTIALRTSRTLVSILIIGAVVAGILIAKSADQGESIGFIVGISVYLNLFLSQLLKFDFRGDLDHLDVLRSLPLRSTAVAAAQVVVPALILSVIQLVLLTTIAFAGKLSVAYLIAIALFAIPVNLLAVGVDNLIFLLFPFRPRPAVAGDMTLIGRQTIVFLCRFLLIVAIAAFAAGVGWSAWLVSDHSYPTTAIAAWLPLIGLIVLIIWLTGLAYGKFDPSVNTPT